MARFKLNVLAAALAAFFLVAAGCGSDDESSTTTTNSAGSETESTTTTTEAAVDTSGALVGEWTAEAQDIIGANTSNLGGVGGDIMCTGTLHLTFNADGTFENTGEVVCTVAGASATGAITSTGNWTAGSEGNITISETVSSGTLTMGPVELPIEAGMSDGEFEYSIDGDQLALTFTDPNVGTVTQMWTRA